MADVTFSTGRSGTQSDASSEDTRFNAVLSERFNAVLSDASSATKKAEKVVEITTPEGFLNKIAPSAYGIGVTLDPSLTGMGKPIIAILIIGADVANDAVKRAIGQGDVEALQELVDPENLSLLVEFGDTVATLRLGGGPVEIGTNLPGSPQIAPLPGGQRLIAFANKRATLVGPNPETEFTAGSVNGGIVVSIPFSDAPFDAAAKSLLAWAASNNALALAGPGGAAAVLDDLPLAALAGLISTGKVSVGVGYRGAVTFDAETGDVTIKAGKTTYKAPASLLPEVVDELFGLSERHMPLPSLDMPETHRPLGQVLADSLVASGTIRAEAVKRAQETSQGGGRTALANAILDAVARSDPPVGEDPIQHQLAFRTHGMDMDTANFAAISFQRLMDQGLSGRDAWSMVWDAYVDGRDAGTASERAGLRDGGTSGGRAALHGLLSDLE